MVFVGTQPEVIKMAPIERDVDGLTEKLIYLIEHPEIWPEMGQVGRAYIEANYDINKLNDRLVEIYTKVINEP